MACKPEVILEEAVLAPRLSWIRLIRFCQRSCSGSDGQGDEHVPGLRTQP